MIQNQSTQTENQRNIESMYAWRLSRHEAEKRAENTNRLIARLQHTH